MAIDCRNFGFDEPLGIRRGICLQGGEGPRVKVTAGTEKGATETQAESNEGQKERAKTILEAKKLHKPTLDKLNGILGKLDDARARIFTDHLDQALLELSLIEGLKDRVTKSIYDKMIQNFWTKYDDLDLLTDRDLFELQEARREVADRVSLMERHSVKTDALAFLRRLKGSDDTTGEALGSEERAVRHLKPGRYRFDFIDPRTGKVNTQIKNALTLGNTLQAAGFEAGESVIIPNKDGSETTAYLHTDGRTYDKSEGSPNPKYIAVVQNSEFIVPEKLEEDFEIQGLKPDNAVTMAEARPEPNATIFDVAGGEKIFYIGERKVNTDTIPDKINTQNCDILLNQEKQIPDHFKGENSYEQIRKMKYVKGGDKVYAAVDTLARLLTANGIPTDNKTMWDDLRGGCLIGGGKFTITFGDIVRSVYGITKSQKKLLKEYKEAQKSELATLQTFMDAARDILDNIDKSSTQTDEEIIDVEDYKSLRAKESFSDKELQALANFTDKNLFSRESYGPPMKLKAYEALLQTCNIIKKAPEINEDNWITPEARFRKGKGHKNFGEMEIISEARAYDKLVEVAAKANTQEQKKAYVDALNKYIALGSAQFDTMKAFDESLNNTEGINGKMDKWRFSQKKGADASLNIKINDFDPKTFVLSNAQKKAIHYGMMLEASIELAIVQEATSGDITNAEVDSGNEGLNLGLGGVVSTNVNAGDLGEMINEGYAAGSVGAVYETKNGFNAAGIATYDTQENLTPSVKGGKVWQMGKRDRWTLEVWGRGSKMKTRIIPYAGVRLAYKLNEINSIGAGAEIGNKQLEIRPVSWERDLGKVFEKRRDAFVERNKEKINQAKDLYASQIKNIYANTTIASEKDAFKYGIEQLLMYEIDRQVLSGYDAFVTPRLTELGALVKVGYGNNKPEVQAGLYGGLGIGTRMNMTYTLPPISAGVGDQTDSAGKIQKWIEEGAVGTAVEIPTALYVNDEDGTALISSKNEAKNSMETKLREANNRANESIKSEVVIGEIGTNGFAPIDFKNLDGTIKLYVDNKPSTGKYIDVINTNDGLLINKNLEDNLNIRIQESKAGHGGNNSVEIFISTDVSRTPEAIKKDNTSYITWAEIAGKKSNVSVIRSKDDTAGNTHIYNNLGGDQMPQAKQKNPAEYATELKYHKMLLMQSHKEARLFAEYNEKPEKQEAKAVGEAIYKEWEKTKKPDYDSLAMGDQNVQTEYNKLVTAKYKEMDSEKYSGTTQPTLDQIYMARQVVMQLMRPNLSKMPLKWNTEAFLKLTGDPKDANNVGRLFTEYMANNQRTLEDKKKVDKLTGKFSQGAEFMVYISDKAAPGTGSDAKILEGYYDPELHGKILIPITWDEHNPNATLNQLGEEKTDANREAVLQIAKQIRELKWLSSPFNCPGTCGFEQGKDSTVGSLVIAEARNLFGSNDGDTLEQLALGTKTSNESTKPLETEFLKAIKDLYDNGKTMIRGIPVILDTEVTSGLYERCMNLTVGRNFALKYQKPEAKSAAVSVKREKIVTGITPKESMTWTKIAASTGSKIPSVGKGNSSETGSDTENNQSDLMDSTDGNESNSHSPRGQ
ncbi:MAG: hypothetical protein WC846_04330 [Candidatus Gracilibacteria bacterium]|jgi:hypothetical protein